MLLGGEIYLTQISAKSEPQVSEFCIPTATEAEFREDKLEFPPSVLCEFLPAPWGVRAESGVFQD